MMKICSSFILDVQLYLLRKLLIFLSLPIIFQSCHNITPFGRAAKKHALRNVTCKPDTTLSDTTQAVKAPMQQPVFYDPTIQVDYGVIMQEPLRPVYFEPFPATEYGIVHPDSIPEE